jgi:hypothetical protein
MHKGVGEEGWGHLMYPAKDIEKLDERNAIKLENRGPSHRFSHIP